jgi:cell division protein FtsB
VSPLAVRRARWSLALLVALAMAMFLFGFPLRTYVEQRSALGQARATAARLATDNRSLRAQAARLQTPAEIERLARQRYGLVRPGQEEYAILPAPGYRLPGAPPVTVPAAGPSPAPSPGSSPGGAPGRARAGPHAHQGQGGLLSRFLHQLEFWS